ncbi:MAG: aldo/keto reductase [Candidatus Rokubacteria bacterium GWC2_70_16]|nr:MAG: aldo/keto reductase [Candidatus Rokubacteria bacterium GWC2_70_16]OGL16329.1 MAG: aldo/keto reductase [Candidatus Rokubacteria bacterium RIFCSPLOWO2_12_FULL_71_19]
MRRRALGRLEVSSLGLGCMSMTPIYGQPDPAGALETLLRAPDLGIDLIDTSDAYGHGKNEELVARALTGRRHRYVVSTKFGNLRLPDGTPAVNGRPEYVPGACDASLKRLGIDTIDLYFLHRVDPSVPIEDTVGAMGRLVEQGKVRHLGLSEAGATTIRRAHAACPLTAVQTEYSLWTRDVESEILPTCRELGIGFVAYAALGRGFLTGAIQAERDLPEDDIRRKMPRFQGENLAHNRALVADLERLAAAEGCTPAQLAIGWVLSRGDDIVPIAGTSRKERLEENAAAAGRTLSTETVQALEATFAPGAARGVRTVPALLSRLGL